MGLYCSKIACLFVNALAALTCIRSIDLNDFHVWTQVRIDFGLGFFSVPEVAIIYISKNGRNRMRNATFFMLLNVMLYVRGQKKRIAFF